jgi:hypothetical protein
VPKTRPPYPPEFRREAIWLVRASGEEGSKRWLAAACWPTSSGSSEGSHSIDGARSTPFLLRRIVLGTRASHPERFLVGRYGGAGTEPRSQKVSLQEQRAARPDC